MGKSGETGQPGLDFPYLDDAYRLKRDQEIADEVASYLEEAHEALVLNGIQQLKPEAKRKPIPFPERPDTLYWLTRVDAWGLPNPGTFLDQPAEFLADVEAARRGRDQYARQQSKTASPASFDPNDFGRLFPDAPPSQPLRTR